MKVLELAMNWASPSPTGQVIKSGWVWPKFYHVTVLVAQPSSIRVIWWGCRACQVSGRLEWPSSISVLFALSPAQPYMWDSRANSASSRIVYSLGLIDYFNPIQNCMGVSCSCPLAVYFDFENGFESVVKSINDEQTTPIRSVSFKGKDSEPKILQPLGSGKLLEGSVRYRARKTQTMKKFTETLSRLSRSGSSVDLIPHSPILDPNSPKHEAAIKLQKVYKSFRTRRKLADCAVLIEQSWWKLLDFAELKHSSISFFDIEKHETAISRWSRARTRAAKVGKGLSENSKAQKLALQHWLEAMERKAYEVAVEDGKLFYNETGELLNTTNEPKGSKWIFVLSTSRTLYVGKKKKGSFQHSSFLAGGATLAAGRIVAENGILKAVWPHSGHYRPTPENFQDYLSFLRDSNVDLTDVKLDSIDDEEESSAGKHVRSHSSGDDLTEKDTLEIEENEEFISKKVVNSEEENAAEIEAPKLWTPHSLSKLQSLRIPSKNDLLETLKTENEISESSTGVFLLGSPTDEYLTAKDSFAPEEQDDETKEDTITEEHILRRINSHKDMKSFQLGKQLSCKWSTGAGPRIGCLRDYPSGLQSHALEQVNLSPRSNRRVKFEFPSRASTPTGSNLSRSSSTSLGCSFHLQRD
ncbi:hypothetical protein DH2020_021888 [Rehmannia glutinosa]|uniref:IQ domain-containing protein n=1 Tax=Rehmannia glutinosa TaxID=99300 RepID=A0ABR0WE06_REHGL